MFSYVVTFFDNEIRATTTEKGIVAAETYGKAADRLVSFYGKSFLMTMALTELNDILTEEEITEEFETQGED